MGGDVATTNDAGKSLALSSLLSSYFESSHFSELTMKIIKKNISAKDGSGSVMLRPDNAGAFVSM